MEGAEVEMILAFDESRDGSPTPEASVVQIAGILTNGNPDVLRDFKVLARDRAAFAAQHAEWYGEMFEEDEEDEAYILQRVTAFWLVGHDTPYKFGGYVDWKEATEEIVAHLREAIQNLGYPLDVDAIPFTGEEFTDEALVAIDAHFREKGYTLVSLDTGGDCYHLFVVPLEKFPRLVELGEGCGMHFFNTFTD